MGFLVAVPESPQREIFAMDTLRLFVAALGCLTVVAGCSCDDAAQNEDLLPKMGITGPAPGVTTRLSSNSLAAPAAIPMPG